MSFMNWIIQELNDLSAWFYELYYECYYAGFPLDVLDYWFLLISNLFNDLAWDFSGFFSWLLTKLALLDNILSWSTIWSYILSYIPNLTQIRDWFYNWWNNVYYVVTDWWSDTQWTVKSWIDQAVSGFQDLINQVNAGLVSLRSAWDSFKGRIPTIDGVIAWWSNWSGNVTGVIEGWWAGAMADVQDLINSAFQVRESLWSGWQEIRDPVVEFFTDPEDWLYKSMDRIIERFW